MKPLILAATITLAYAHHAPAPARWPQRSEVIPLVNRSGHCPGPFIPWRNNKAGLIICVRIA